jgi:hypothetical protein
VTQTEPNLAPTRELFEKLRYFLPIYDKAKFVGELYVHTTIERRTILKWLNTPVIAIHNSNRTLIVDYLKRKHDITFSYDWFSCEIEEMKNQHRARTNSADETKTNVVRTGTPLISPPQPYTLSVGVSGASELTKEHIELLCGKYELYRYSFSDRGDVVLEMASITSIPNNNFELAITMNCHPAHESKRPEPRTRETTEEFVGKLFRMGMMFSAICSYSKPRDRRMRYLLFPVLEVDREQHYGLVSGYSPNLREPVAARIFAKRISRDPELVPSDYSRIQRGGLNDSKGPNIPRDILSLIANRIEGEKSSILSVDQRKVPRQRKN